MLTLRAIPARRAAPAENRLLASYHGGLLDNWRSADRRVGALLGQAGLGAGWSRAERRFLSADVRRHGLSMAERKGLHRLLSPAAFPLAANPLKNKALFATRAIAAGLATPDTFDADAEPLGGWLDRQEAIVAKPSYSSKGRGIALFVRSRDGWLGEDAPLPTARLADRLRPLITAHGVVQVQAITHPALAALSPGALPTLRIMTCRSETGAIEACWTALRLSAGGGAPVDNFNAGNLVLGVSDDARCGTAYRRQGETVTALDRHPATGERLAQVRIPYLAAATALARAAHRALAGAFTVVGWDIGVTDDGPLLIEGNWNPGTDIVQLVDRVGLDRTRLGALYRHHLDRLAEGDWRRARPIEIDRRAA